MMWESQYCFVLDDTNPKNPNWNKKNNSMSSDNNEHNKKID